MSLVNRIESQSHRLERFALGCHSPGFFFELCLVTTVSIDQSAKQCGGGLEEDLSFRLGNFFDVLSAMPHHGVKHSSHFQT